MKPSDVLETLTLCAEADQPVMLTGPPGCAKSSICYQLADVMTDRTGQEYTFTDMRPVLMDPVDAEGLPVPVKENGQYKTVRAIPANYPTAPYGIWLLDELVSAPPMVQAVFYQLIFGGRIGSFVKPAGQFIVAAGNREIDRAVVHRMPSALANRFVHIEVEIDLADWVTWALNNGIRTDVIAFHRAVPDYLYRFNPSKNDKAFPTLRTWEFVSRLMDTDPPKHLQPELIGGIVGPEAANRYLGFLALLNQLPDIDHVIMNPETAIIPTGPAPLYAIAGALARKATATNFGRILKYAERLPEEFNLVLVRDATERTPELCSTREYIDWTSKHQDVLI